CPVAPAPLPAPRHPHPAAFGATHAGSGQPQCHGPQQRNCCAPWPGAAADFRPAVAAAWGRYRHVQSCRDNSWRGLTDFLRQGIAPQLMRQTDINGHRQMVGNRLVEHMYALQTQTWAQQDMVQAALRLPARERGRNLRLHQAEFVMERMIAKTY